MAEATQAQNPSARKPHCSIGGCSRPVHARRLCNAHYLRRWKRGDPGDAAVRKKTPDGEALAFLEALPEVGDGCVTWPFLRSASGYGKVYIPGTGMRAAHRIVCERVNGPPPTPAHQSAHSCGKGHEACVAPWHLSWKTPVENCADRIVHGTLARGERSGQAKLTEAQVREIRALAGTASQEEIGRKFGVSQINISVILRRASWAHI